MSEKRLWMWDGWRSAARVLLTFVLLYFLAAFLTGGVDELLYGNRHGNARTAACESNMKQLGLAFGQYSQDSDETLPRDTNAAGHGWREAIYPYVKASGIYHCPDDSRDYSYDAPDNLPKSYTVNHVSSTYPLRQKMFANPARTISVIDTRGYDGEQWDMTSPAFLPSSHRALYAHTGRHLFYQHPAGRLNCLFADGHVRSYNPMKTLAPINLWTPNNMPFVGQDLSNARAILTHAEEK